MKANPTEQEPETVEYGADIDHGNVLSDTDSAN
jgi:hypothetical protein